MVLMTIVIKIWLIAHRAWNLGLKNYTLSEQMELVRVKGIVKQNNFLLKPYRDVKGKGDGSDHGF